jgi:hypothetical protein
MNEQERSARDEREHKDLCDYLYLIERVDHSLRASQPNGALSQCGDKMSWRLPERPAVKCFAANGAP